MGILYGTSQSWMQHPSPVNVSMTPGEQPVQHPSASKDHLPLCGSGIFRSGSLSNHCFNTILQQKGRIRTVWKALHNEVSSAQLNGLQARLPERTFMLNDSVDQKYPKRFLFILKCVLGCIVLVTQSSSRVTRAFQPSTRTVKCK